MTTAADRGRPGDLPRLGRPAGRAARGDRHRSGAGPLHRADHARRHGGRADPVPGRGQRRAAGRRGRGAAPPAAHLTACCPATRAGPATRATRPSELSENSKTAPGLSPAPPQIGDQVWVARRRNHWRRGDEDHDRPDARRPDTSPTAAVPAVPAVPAARLLVRIRRRAIWPGSRAHPPAQVRRGRGGRRDGLRAGVRRRYYPGAHQGGSRAAGQHRLRLDRLRLRLRPGPLRPARPV